MAAFWGKKIPIPSSIPLAPLPGVSWRLPAARSGCLAPKKFPYPCLWKARTQERPSDFNDLSFHSFVSRFGASREQILFIFPGKIEFSQPFLFFLAGALVRDNSSKLGRNWKHLHRKKPQQLRDRRTSPKWDFSAVGDAPNWVFFTSK